MNSFPARLLAHAVFTLIFASVAHAQLIVGFEDLPTPPTLTSSQGIQFANSNSLVYDGITWDANLSVVGKNYAVSGTTPLFSGGAADGGNYYITNQGDVDGITLTTSKVLTSLYLGSTEIYGYYPGEGASQVTIVAMSGRTVLDSLTFDLTPNTQTGGPSNTAVGMDLFDTSEFTSLTGITGYIINRTPNSDQDSDNGNASWVADNFTFVDPVAVPEPSSGQLALLVGLVLIGSLGLKRLRTAQS